QEGHAVYFQSLTFRSSAAFPTRGDLRGIIKSMVPPARSQRSRAGVQLLFARNITYGDFRRGLRSKSVMKDFAGKIAVITGGGSRIANSRDHWEHTFNVCWGGVYLCTRAFLPMLVKSTEGHLINTSSVNGFWASIGPGIPHTAYSAAKFAVKGFTEALINDLKINAPHIRCSVVMPGHIGTSIPLNSRKIQSGNLANEMDARQLAQARARITSIGRA